MRLLRDSSRCYSWLEKQMRPVNHRASQWGAVSVASQGQCPETRKDSGADPGSHTHHTAGWRWQKSLQLVPGCTTSCVLIFRFQCFIFCLIWAPFFFFFLPLRLSSFFYSRLQAMFLSRDGQYLLMGGDGGVVSVWQVHDLKQLFTYPGCDAGIRSMAMSHDQRYAPQRFSPGWSKWTLLASRQKSARNKLHFVAIYSGFGSEFYLLSALLS